MIVIGGGGHCQKVVVSLMIYKFILSEDIIAVIFILKLFDPFYSVLLGL